MRILENSILKIQIDPKGAELRSAYRKDHQLEYMWSADPAVWPRVSPVLFPIVGRLKNDQYRYEGNTYTLSQHGFARNMDFEVLANTSNTAVFLLESNDATRENYPFDFQLLLSYTLLDEVLELQYEVINKGNEKMYFSLGMHPGFKIPLKSNEQYSDYYIETNNKENAERYLIEGGLISENREAVFQDSQRIDLNLNLFNRDALVFKNLKSTELSIRSKNHSHGISLQAHDFPYYGIWAQKGAEFVCLEPWCGIADVVEANGDIKMKEGIQVLASSEVFLRKARFRFF